MELWIFFCRIFKYISSEMAARYSNAPDYPEIAKRALAQMVKQTGDAKI